MSTLLRIATAGSVDDGKSTLVGRLLYDSKAVLADQLEAVERVSLAKGLGHVDLALLTDGLRAEREQGITIDVAYRYFATAKRTFILADCPGHVQYTRNTVTGSSTADVLVLLVDARKGALEQTRRHLAVGQLLRVPHIVVAVNKIDLVDYSAQRFAEIDAEINGIADDLGVPSIRVLPVSALVGDNIVDRSEKLSWYDGPSLLELLEDLPAADATVRPFRFPVQLTIRPQDAALDPRYVEYRGYAGQVASGVVRVGDPVVVLPSGRRTTVVGIDTADGELAEAFAPQSVTLRLADDIDITRGELIAGVDAAPEPTQDLDGMVAWLAERPLRVGQKVLVKHTTRTTQAVVRDIDGRLDLDTLRPQATDSLELNDLGRVRLRLAAPIMAEAYADSRRTGSFLLVDPQSGTNLAAGMIRGDQAFSEDAAVEIDATPNWSI
ncbi:sulfate adenylyltransferase subunit 1 [Tessaracoccus flavus]|uniref:Sulfate adenylyltransferase n=1 Tax=Tessaracoccus flavus TaxID=1610493 RepID=A0A1Q2CBI2_9ACTN|nr:GTP-binding protein [Tessaracoccus flavus]AQP43405.1 sulfate adenylyltransferase [Tessaracoccus flavus]SDZ05398.1 sulfate adenylyltransferase subunit 1 [Tessaracoccus flavus]